MRFFDYSPAATTEYKTVLENTVNTLDRARDASSYLLPAAAAVTAILLVLQISLSKAYPDKAETYTNGFNGAALSINAVFSAINLILKNVVTNMENTAKELINDGVTNHFFNTAPVPVPYLAANEAAIESGIRHRALEIDAVTRRLLG